MELQNMITLSGSIRRHILVAGAFVCLLFIGIGGWLALAHVSGAVVATGTVVVEGNIKEVQHQEGGIIKDIKVEDGDLVKSGDLLVVLDDTQVRSEWESVVKQLYELRAQQDRLLAEQKEAKDITFSSHKVDTQFVSLVNMIKNDQTRLFQARRNSFSRQKAQLLEQISQLEQQISGLKAESEAKNVEMNLVSQELADVSSLFEKSFVSKSDVTSLTRDKTQLQGGYRSLLSQIEEDKKAISERQIQMAQLEEDKKADTLQQLQDTRLNIASLERQKVALEDQLARLTIRAPISGYIHNLIIHTVGGVISPGEVVTSLVPENNALLIEAQIRPIDIDKLSLEQKTRIRFPNFDQKTTPELMAKIKTISADLLQDPISGSMYYQARFSIEKDELAKLNGKKLIPGMPVEVFAKTEDRTVLSYLLKPIRDQISYALREK